MLSSIGYRVTCIISDDFSTITLKARNLDVKGPIKTLTGVVGDFG